MASDWSFFTGVVLWCWVVATVELLMVTQRYYRKENGYMFGAPGEEIQYPRVNSASECLTRCGLSGNLMAVILHASSSTCFCRERCSVDHIVVDSEFATYINEAVILLSGFVRLDANHSYLISNATASWREARNMCIQYGGDLVVIETVEELEELKDYIVNIDSLPDSLAHWIGLNDINSEGSFVWLSTSRLEDFDNWVTDQPDGTVDSEDCVAMHEDDDFEFSDCDCSEMKYYICERGCADWEEPSSNWDEDDGDGDEAWEDEE